MNTKHTPGPWKWKMAGTFDKSSVTAPTGTGDHVTIATTDLSHLRTAFAITGEVMPEGFLPHNEEANARLIAAAPELLDELRKCRNVIAHCISELPQAYKEAARTQMNKAGEAIAKATNETL